MILNTSFNLTDAQRLEANAFCSCATGQQERRLAEYRQRSWQQWQQATITASANNRHNVPVWARLPEKYAGLTLAGMKHLSTANGDWSEKRPAIDRLAVWMRDGHVVSSRGTRKRSLLIWSNERGVGKSGAVAAVFSEWLRRGHGGVWLDFFQLIPLVRSTYRPDSELDRQTIVSTAQEAELLVLDDLGDVARSVPENDHTREIINEIVRYRHGNDLPTIYTTNHTPESLVDSFDVALFQRVMEMSVAVEMGGGVLRDLG